MLSLHGNHLKTLPIMNRLENLHDLDISNNPIVVDKFLLDSLFSLPNLIRLKIDVQKEGQ